MKHREIIRYIPLGMAVLAFVLPGSASATIFTGSGGTTLGVGTTISGESEGTVTLHPPIGDISCSSSTASGTITNAGGSSETVKGTVSSATFSGCNATVTVLSKGSWEGHRTGGAFNGILTKLGFEVTIEFIGTHCIFKASGGGTGGTLTGSGTTGGNATVDISGSIPRTGGRSGAFCGTEAQFTGSYKITNPSTLNVD